MLDGCFSKNTISVAYSFLLGIFLKKNFSFCGTVKKKKIALSKSVFVYVGSEVKSSVGKNTI